jgi:hypothetical protein
LGEVTLGTPHCLRLIEHNCELCLRSSEIAGKLGLRKFGVTTYESRGRSKALRLIDLHSLS